LTCIRGRDTLRGRTGRTTHGRAGAGIPVKIMLNGDPMEVAAPLTIGALLVQLDIDPRRVAIEHNLVVLKRRAYDDTTIADGDQIEIVNLVGGGARSLDDHGLD
jgi:sulfur carrier protein